MTILMVGSGGREHALIRKLAESPRVTRLICAPGNGGVACDAECFPVSADDLPGMLALARRENADLVFVAPDDPLALGMVDMFPANGIRAFGPSKAAARIEASKVFAKGIMAKYGIPTAEYAVFESAADALTYIKEKGAFPVVVKADGLALGKGVVIAQDLAEAAAALRAMLEDGKFGDSGRRVVVEEFLTGPEVSVLAFTDGVTLAPMISSMDHKRALDGDLGLNTGGMGTVAPNPYYTQEIAAECMEKIFLPTVRAMQNEGCPFAGCLYFGLMLTPNGPKVIEYNARFGDPETQVVLPLLDTPLIDIVDAVVDGRLADIDIKWKDAHAACVVLASGGYPEKYGKGKVISGLNADGQASNVEIFHAGTALDGGQFVTNGGRVLGVMGVGDTLAAALETAYCAVEKISFEGVHYRTDIGKKCS
ncbi:MAG: phosphoribosylamine--glycine ligase [Oscillospiraceae bacterium]|jgi:phosphoribosylamine--glycine ligase|nr:phosphoribosylamine--glycine ligase [Oscillospiraceae bacterium]